VPLWQALALDGARFRLKFGNLTSHGFGERDRSSADLFVGYDTLTGYRIDFFTLRKVPHRRRS